MPYRKPISWCNDCAADHSAERRQDILERLGNVTPREVYERLEGLAEHLWGEPKQRDGRGGQFHSQTLRWDLAQVRARNGWQNLHQPKPYDEAFKASVAALKLEGLGSTEIARRIGCTRGRVDNYLKDRKPKETHEQG